MALNFPNNPGIGSVYTDSTSGFSYQWNGTLWQSYSSATAANIQILDDISGSFNGSTLTFALTSGGTAVSPVNAQQLDINLGGVIQAPGTDYTISGSNITFTGPAPTSGLTFSGKLLGTALSLNTIPDGAVTPPKLSAGGPSWNSGGDLNVTGIGTFGNLTVTDAVTAGNVNVTGVVTAVGGFNIGIQSAGNPVTTGVITAINFVGAGNTLQYNPSTKTVDVSIAGGGGGAVGVSSGGTLVGTGITNINFVGAAVTNVGLTTSVVTITKTLTVGRRDTTAVSLNLTTSSGNILLRDGSTQSLPL